MGSKHGEWVVIDPQRVAAGFYGKTFHKTRAEAERRVAMFPGSVMEWVPQ